MKLRKILLAGTTALCAVPVLLTAAQAQEYLGTSNNNQNLILTMNNDGTSGEGLILRDNVANGADVFAQILNNSASFSGSIYDINDNTVNIGENMAVNGQLEVFGNVGLEGVLYDTNSTVVSVYDSLYVRDDTALNGSLSVAGTAAVTGNATFSANTDIQGFIYNSADDGDGGDMPVVVNDNLGVTGSAEVIGNLDVSGQSTLDRTNITGVTNINVSGTARTTIGANSNTTVMNSQDIIIGNGPRPSNGDRTYVSIATDSSADRTVRIGNGNGDTVIGMQAGSSSLDAIDGSLVGNVNGVDEGLYAQINISDNGDQLVADENGKIIAFEGGEGNPLTASLIVRSSAGAIHGLVIQEDKLTLSGGTASSSLTLDDRGATFSDPADGKPIQVHGVDDGTAPFDAVNVRQLYSGLAAVLAATPELRLEPGKTGFGIGFGAYGGYKAVGMGFGRMYENGAILTGSVSKAEFSEVAGRASISWNW